jgi:hypothetical protein
MTFALKRRLTAFSLVLILCAGTALAAPGDVGTPAADFNLQVYGGGTQSLNELSGKVVMLFIIGYA